jgi:hypothetical protein
MGPDIVEVVDYTRGFEQENISGFVAFSKIRRSRFFSLKGKG